MTALDRFLPPVRHLPAGALLFLVLTLSPAAAVAGRLAAEAALLAHAGASSLALSMLSLDVPDPFVEPGRWAARARVRMEIMADNGHHDEVVAFTPPAGASLPEDFLPWLRTRQVESSIALGDGNRARVLLRSLIWGDGDTGSMRYWRQLVAESYTVDGLAADAFITWHRFRQDYPDAATEVAVAQARALLEMGEAAAVPLLLADVDGHEARALSLLAGVRAGGLTPADAARESRRLAEEAEVDGGDAMRYFHVAAEAAREARDMRLYAVAAGRAATIAVTQKPDPLFSTDVTDLWERWHQFGVEEGNKRRLLIGDGDSWIAAAEEAEEEGDRDGARALLTVVAVRSDDPGQRRGAHERLAALLVADPDGQLALSAFYQTDDPRHTDSELPSGARLLLANSAMGRGDFARAAELLADMDQAPMGDDGDGWRLVRARALILGGREEAGIDALHEILAGLRRFEAEEADRFLQAVFDLQAVHRHDAALALLVAVEPRLADARRRRELLYWQAESNRVLGHPELAARLYLRSALAIPGGMDSWGQSARFLAAESLVEAGLTGDARRIYEGLLAVARSPERRATIRQRLQKLALSE